MMLSRETKVGLLVVIAGAILYIGFNFLKGIDFFSNQNTYYVLYKDVNGLQPSNPVVLNGLTVGQVMKITTDPDKKYRMRVQIEVDEDIRLGDSTVSILTSSLLGDMGINLKLGYKAGGINYFEDGDTIYSGMEKDLMAVMEEKLHPIISNIENITGKFDSLMDKNSEKSIRNILNNVEKMSTNFKDFSEKDLKLISGQFVGLSSDIRKSLKGIDPLLAKFTAVADSLANADLKKTVQEMNALLSNLSSITSKIDTTNGTLGKLINDSTLYVNLNATLDSVNVLIEKMSEKNGHVVVNVIGDPYKKEERWQKRKAKRETKDNN